MSIPVIYGYKVINTMKSVRALEIILENKIRETRD